MNLCRHCHRNKASRPRGLCFGCYGNVEIRQQYPVNGKYWPRHAGWKGGVETMADLEALIAEQMANLPDWWESEQPAREFGHNMAGESAEQESRAYVPRCVVRQYPRGRRVGRKGE